MSDQGRVRSLARPRHPGRVLKPRLDSQGYALVTLSQDDQQRTRFVHRLVALAFLGPCPPGREVRHLDGDPANCRVGNLAYGTHRENELDKRTHGTHHNAVKTHCPQGHEYTPENTYVEPRRATGRRCKACREAETEIPTSGTEARELAGSPARPAHGESPVRGVRPGVLMEDAEPLPHQLRGHR